MTEDHIVEVYAAADSFEAERLRELLAEAGIQATVVGDEINHVAGSMPYGGVASPRIWVHEQYRDEAARLIEQWIAEKTDTASLSNESEADDQAEEEFAPVEVEGISALGKVLMLFGLGCILLGASFGWSNFKVVQTYSGEIEAQRVNPSVQIPPPLAPGSHTPIALDVAYQYQVNGKSYRAVLAQVSNPDDAPAAVPVHYHPGNPGEHLVGRLPSPWLPLIFGAFFGSLIMFIVYRLN